MIFIDMKMQLNEVQKLQKIAGLLNESEKLSNSTKEITVILGGNKEISYTEEDINQFIEDLENDPTQISSDNLPGWLYREVVSKKKISQKNKSKAVIKLLQDILNSKRDVRIILTPNTPPDARGIVYLKKQ